VYNRYSSVTMILGLGIVAALPTGLVQGHYVGI
jgi:hypothetical protein